MKSYLTAIIAIICISSICLAQAQQSKPTLYLFLSDECIITQYYVPTINDIAAEFGDHIDMVAIFPNFSSKPKKIDAFYQKYKLNIPHKTDYYKTLSKSLGATVTPEAILVNNKGQIIYQGRIDNSYVQIGKRRRVVTKHELTDALSATVTNKEIAESETKAIGCFINFKDQISQQ